MNADGGTHRGYYGYEGEEYVEDTPEHEKPKRKSAAGRKLVRWNRKSYSLVPW
jgi:hypothetical protein